MTPKAAVAIIFVGVARVFRPAITWRVQETAVTWRV